MVERLILAGLLITFTMCLAWGSSWDAHWHWWIGRDATWIPPHVLLYIGIGMSAALGLLLARRGRSGRWSASIRPASWRLPQASQTVGAGAAAMFTAAIIDIVWHRTIGDRTVWSPPHVLFVLGGLTVGLGTATAFVQAGRDGLVRGRIAKIGPQAFAGVLLGAGSFSLVPVAMLAFRPGRAATGTLVYAPSPYGLALFASLIMPALCLVAIEVLAQSGWSRRGAVAATGLAFWGGQEMLHLALTPPVSAALGYTMTPFRFPDWPLELAVFAAALTPVLAADRLAARRPFAIGACAGVLYAGAVQLGLNLFGGPEDLSVWDVATCGLVGGVSGLAGFATGRWIGRVIHRKPQHAGAAQQGHPRPIVEAVVTDVLAGLARISPGVKRWLWRRLYGIMAARDDDAEWAFMNYGFADLSPDAIPLPLAPADEKDRLAIQLYHRVAASADLQGRDVLEVGCGRGGGTSYIARYLRPRAVVGLDVSHEAIAHCRRHRAGSGVSFVQGDAEALPFEDGHFDVVVNVESSHCYGSMERFLAEAYRVLRPGGLLLFADLRFHDAVGQLRRQLRASQFRLLEERTITSNIVRALEQDHDRKLVLISQKVPASLRGPFLVFAGTRGTQTFEALRSGDGQYLCCVLQKALAEDSEPRPDRSAPALAG